MEFLTPTYHLRKDEMTTLCKECLQNGYRTYGGTDDEHHHTMPNPTPQQRIEELVREFEKWFVEFDPGTSASMNRVAWKASFTGELRKERLDIKDFLRQALKQAYVAGLEAVEKHCPSCATEPGFAGGRDCPGIAISQLKEQINQ